MIIRKYLHSCILLEQDGYRLLFDPGTYSFLDGQLKPEDIPAPDTIVITHSHADHCDAEAIARIRAPKNPDVYVPTGFEARLKGGHEPRTFDDTDEFRAGPFVLHGVDAPHEAIAGQTPANVGVLVDDRVLHPGDSLRANVERVEILCLPIAAPWLREVDALAFAERLRPRVIIPIHDIMLKEFFLENKYRQYTAYFQQRGIEFYPLGLGQTLEC